VVATVFRHGFGGPALDPLTCAADLTPAIITEWGVPLALGRTSRLASRDQMKALCEPPRV
jgi:hypothetical protein